MLKFQIISLVYNYKLTVLENSEKVEYPPDAHTPVYIKPVSPTIACPYCKSTDCKKITATAKAVNIALFGIFGNKRRHQWHCEKCGSDF